MSTLSIGTIPSSTLQSIDPGTIVAADRFAVFQVLAEMTATMKVTGRMVRNDEKEELYRAMVDAAERFLEAAKLTRNAAFVESAMGILGAAIGIYGGYCYIRGGNELKKASEATAAAGQATIKKASNSTEGLPSQTTSGSPKQAISRQGPDPNGVGGTNGTSSRLPSDAPSASSAPSSAAADSTSVSQAASPNNKAGDAQEIAEKGGGNGPFGFVDPQTGLPSAQSDKFMIWQGRGVMAHAIQELMRQLGMLGKASLDYKSAEETFAKMMREVDQKNFEHSYEESTEFIQQWRDLLSQILQIMQDMASTDHQTNRSIVMA